MSTTTTNQPKIAKAYGLGIIKQSVAVCVSLDVPLVIWGGVGVGKSSLVRQLAEELGIPLYDVRLSDKEPSDLAGIPAPDHSTGRIVYMVSDLIPFVGITLSDGTVVTDDYECLLFLDEYDRCDKATENVSLQLTLDRVVNGKRLPKKCRILAAGNGSSDNGTAVLSDAAATRLVHFYVDTQGSEALDSWERWADNEGIGEDLKGFARWRQPMFTGSASEFLELQKPTPRTFVAASRLADACDTLPFGEDVIEPIIYGAVGQTAGREYLAFRKLFKACPTQSQIVADPVNATLPQGEHQFGLLFALGSHLLTANTRDGAEADKAVTKSYATYAGRWPEEQKAHFFKRASRVLTSIVHTPEYKRWEKEARLN